MKKVYKYLFIIIFIMSFYVFMPNTKADYKASAINQAGAKCSLSSKSTGYCYYANSNLNSTVPRVVWLDTGDEVTVLTSYDTVDSPNKSVCADYYVYTSYYSLLTSSLHYGYYCHANLSSEEISDELKEEFKALGFPESYWNKLATLKQAHPNWDFKAINTGLNFSDVVTSQTYGDKSLLRKSMSNNYAYLDISEASFNYKENYFYAYDDTSSSDPWYKANYDAIAYYLDPRNFLNDMYIFQFETLSYNSNVTDENVKSSLNSIFSGGILSNYIDTFLAAGKISGVNPIYLASLSKEEVGNGSTPSTAISGTYNGMYNFYNIGAYSGSDPVYNGLDFAANTDESTMRPWNTEYKAIVGGAKWIYNSYVYHGQDTSYFKKFNVIYNYLISINRTPAYSNYSHQYMQNISAPSSEAYTTYHSYYKNNILDLSYTFYIPVYNNMPSETSLPTTGGWPNNYLSNISINGTNIAGFDSDVLEYNYNLDVNTNSVTLDAQSVSDTATITGLGTFDILENTTKTIKVTAQNGNVRNYKINITLTSEKLEDPIDVVTTLNNAGIKNGNKYLTGFEVGMDISVIKDKILASNKTATVILKNSSGEEKNSGIVSTGDKVNIKVGNETREYEIVIYGDVNGDGKIKATDYVLIRNKIMGSITLSGPYLEAADVDKNGAVKATDYVKIKNKIMGIGEISQ